MLGTLSWNILFQNTNMGDKVIQSYYSGLMEIWSEQDQSIGGNLSSTGFKQVMLERKKTWVVQFVMKLRPDYEPIRANILNRETLPDIDVVFGELIREETRINTLASMDSSYTIDAAMYTSKGTHKSYTQSSFQKSGPQCFECKEYGHIASHCKKRNICNYCKKLGHIIQECNRCPNTRQSEDKAYQVSEA